MDANPSRRWSIWVPGRIEVLGKHTDYGGGRSLLCAVERGFCIRAAPRKDAMVRVVDVGLGDRFETSLGANGTPARARGSTMSPRWCAGGRDFPGVKRGVDIVLASDLPAAAGLSSSSALVICTFIALSRANDLRAKPEFRKAVSSREEIAAYLGAVESGSCSAVRRRCRRRHARRQRGSYRDSLL